ncbi:MAG TPA: SDR family NAD(P)-dependent oxidoreductase [Thermoanaerobaculia bacterium]|nr:SDR family NAD(P)-dependent oxidoreductase [Thermoanaerobaculia bacterium]
MKTIVITGASSGIGAALARHLGREGHNLVLASRRAATLNAVAHEVQSHVVTVCTDVTRRADVNRLCDEALRAFGSIDVWVNNAGRGITRPVLELTDGELDEMMAVNVKSALYGMQAVVPHFIARRRGHLINISSFLGRVPIATHRSAYNAAKAALNALTANLRVDLAREYPEIHVSLIMPGLVSTEFARNALGSATATAPPWTPGSTMQPQSAEEVAAAIAGVIEHPVVELYTNPASAPMVRRYFDDVAAFEENVVAGSQPARAG